MSKTPQQKRKGYGLFILAATIYTTGVLAFSVWSYLQQRNNLLEQVDQALIHATYATEQILGRVFIECAVEAEGVYGLGYVANQKNLDRFASDCRFEHLGAVGHKKGASWKLIAGSQEDRFANGDSSPFLDPLSSDLSATIQLLARFENETTRVQTMTSGEHEELRVAIRYHSVGADRGYAILVAQDTRPVRRLIHDLAYRTVAIAIFLHAMAFPLILLYSRTHKKVAKKTTELNSQLKQDFTKQKKREAELKDAIHDLERFNTVAVGRETRIIELKAEVNTLLEQMKRQKRYNVDQTE